MSELNKINDFLSAKDIAIAGVSHNSKKFGYHIFKLFLDKGYNVYPINPKGGEIDTLHCYTRLSELPKETRNLVVVTPKTQTLNVVQEAITANIENIWIQNGCETKEVIDFLKEKKINHIAKRCVFMYTGTVEGIHKFHKTLSKIFLTHAK